MSEIVALPRDVEKRDVVMSYVVRMQTIKQHQVLEPNLFKLICCLARELKIILHLHVLHWRGRRIENTKYKNQQYHILKVAPSKRELGRLSKAAFANIPNMIEHHHGTCKEMWYDDESNRCCDDKNYQCWCRPHAQ